MKGNDRKRVNELLKGEKERRKEREEEKNESTAYIRAEM